MVKNKKVPVTMITGYLGSGKTTLMNELLKKSNQNIVVVVNDLGQVNIDSKLLKTGSVVEEKLLYEMTGGCICCTLREKFMQRLQLIASDNSIDRILVEASGVSNPAGICDGFVSYQEYNLDSNFYLNNVVTVVDASRIHYEFLDKLKDKKENDDADVINLIVDQIEFCNLIILNKSDLLTEEELIKVREVIGSIQPEAEIIETTKSIVDDTLIFNSSKFDFEKVLSSSAYYKALDRDIKNEENGLDDFGIHSFVYKQKKPFDIKKLNKVIENYPIEIIRTKGYVWFSNATADAILFEQAGKNVTLEVTSKWIAAYDMNKQEKILLQYPEVKKDWDPVYGDRINELVIIGKDYDMKKITELFDSCIDVEFEY